MANSGYVLTYAKAGKGKYKVRAGKMGLWHEQGTFFWNRTHKGIPSDEIPSNEELRQKLINQDEWSKTYNID